MRLPKIKLKHRGPTKSDVLKILRLKKMQDKTDTELKNEHKHLMMDANTFRSLLLCLFSFLLATNHDDTANAMELYRVFRHLYEGGSLKDLPLKLVNKQIFLKKVRQVLTKTSLVLDEES
jgi:hypothetical protein